MAKKAGKVAAAAPTPPTRRQIEFMFKRSINEQEAVDMIECGIGGISRIFRGFRKRYAEYMRRQQKSMKAMKAKKA